MAMDYILATKLVIPENHTQTIARTRLMLPAEPTRITLVCAPAGYGKTTLISSWARQTTKRTAWLSLDNHDNDPTQFMLHFISAIQTQIPEFAQSIATQLASSQLPSTTGLVRSLLNELCAFSEPIYVILDDLHALHHASTQDIIRFMVEHQPAALHLIIISRNTPPFSLSKIRAQRQLTEFYTDDLRFNEAEVAQFCNDAMDLDLSPSLLATLETRTEGWIAGLQLAALSLHNTDDKKSFIQSFAGDDRHITDFLMDEVLRHLPTNLQQFLLSTCLLQQLSAPLCDAVRLASDSRQLLDELERTNMFMSSLDHKRLWYRYHHLFASLLKTRLYDSQPDSINIIHHRASRWFNDHGMFAEAIQHSIKAGDYEYAALLMEERSSTLFSLGRFTTALTWAYQLPPELLARHPKLSMLCAWAGLVMDNLPEVERHVRATSACFNGYQLAAIGSKERTLYGQLALISGCQHCLAGDVERAMASIMEALGSLATGRVLYRGASVCLGFCYYAQGELDKAQRLFEENTSISDAKQNLIIPIFATLGLARSHLLLGHFTAAKTTYEKALYECEALGWQDAPACGMLYIGLGELAYEQNDLLNANRLLTKGIDMTSVGQMQYFHSWGQVLLAQTQLALGMSDGLLGSTTEAGLMRYSGRFVVEVPPLSAGLANLWLSQGRIDKVADWVKAAQLPLKGQFAVEREAEYLILARYLITRQRLPEALDLLSRLWFHAEPRHHIKVMVEIQILKALALEAEGATPKALAALQQAITIAGENPFIRLFSQEAPAINTLLHKLAKEMYRHPLMSLLMNAIGQSLSSSQLALTHIETYLLSKKERLVARHIVTGATSQEIAENLCVSLSTIKTHTKNIYAKLGVNKRLQAIDALLKQNLAS